MSKTYASSQMIQAGVPTQSLLMPEQTLLSPIFEKIKGVCAKVFPSVS